jgi:hypothetical protein
MQKPICYEHRTRSKPVPSCAVCQRIRLEQRIVNRTVDALLSAGFALHVEDGESRRPEKPTTEREAIIAELMEVDDEYLVATRAEDKGATRWVRFVYGNGYDVINDYHTGIEDVLKPVNAYADSQS